MWVRFLLDLNFEVLMSKAKYFCLNCFSDNMRCKCLDKDIFYYSSKLRVPLISNKSRFRKFLIDCPIFPNMVCDKQIPKFQSLLRKVKFYGKTINGIGWTNINQ